jgi:hypothetical protein
VAVKPNPGAQILREGIARLIEDLENHPEAWQNLTLPDYLDAIQAWLEDAEESVPEEPSWEFIIKLFRIGKVYE